VTVAAQKSPADEPLSRVARRRNRRLTDILTATADVLAEHGYRETNLDEIAERLDLTRGSLYHYFASKEELVTTCLDWVATLVNERLSAAARQQKGTASQRLTVLIETQLDCIVGEYPQMARLFLQPLDWPEPLQLRSKALRLQHDEIFRSVIRDGIATGEFTVADEAIALHCLHGAVNYVPVWFRPGCQKDYKEMHTIVARQLLRLFRATP
jgi:AcrR family transcriptional regulator